MSTLRTEYKKSKQKKEDIVSEAATRWLAENVIVINEALDRQSVKRLIKSIQRFEDKFGPFADRVPSIKLQLDAAETGLELVVTGRATDKKTSNFIEQMTYLYSTFSDFFVKDLSVLLKSRFFRAAKEQPDQRLDMLPRVSPEGHTHNPEIIKDALANALKPSKEKKKLLGKIYRSTKLPEIQPQKIARELLGLSFNELKELTQIGKTPMVSAQMEPEEEPEEQEPTAPEGLAAESAFNHAGELLSEGILTEVSLEQVGPVLQQVNQIVTNTGLEDLGKPLSDLYTQLTQYLATPDGAKIKQNLAGANERALGDFFKSKGGVLLKQANMAIETLKGLGQAWPKIKPLVDKQNITDQDLLNIKQIISKQVGGGFFKKAAQAFGVSTKPFPGLEPESIVDALTKSTIEEGAWRFNPGVVLERRLEEQATTTAAATTNDSGDAGLEPPTGTEALEGVQKLSKAMQSLYQFATGASDTASAAGTKVSTSAKEPQQTQDTKSAMGTDTAGTGPSSGQEVAGTGQTDIVQGLKAAFPKQRDSDIKNMVAAINKAGYQVVKK